MRSLHTKEKARETSAKHAGIFAGVHYVINIFFYIIDHSCFYYIKGGVLHVATKNHCEVEVFFSEFPRLPLGKLVVLMYLWSVCKLRTTAAAMLSLTKNTVGNVFAVLRHCCGRDLQDRPVVPFGGRVYVVKCDESQFKHKSKVTHFQLYVEKGGGKG